MGGVESLIWIKTLDIFKNLKLVLSCKFEPILVRFESDFFKKGEFVEFLKIIPISFYKEQSGKEPVRAWLWELSDKDRKIIGKDIRVIQID